jgi:hypothetical protein
MQELLSARAQQLVSHPGGLEELEHHRNRLITLRDKLLSRNPALQKSEIQNLLPEYLDPGEPLPDLVSTALTRGALLRLRNLDRRIADYESAIEQRRKADEEAGLSRTGDTDKPSQPPESSPPKSRGRKRGPKPDYETALRTAEIVARVAPDGDWRSRLDDIREVFDEEKMPPPAKWRRDDATCRDWLSQLDRQKVIKVIEHRLGLAKRQPKPTSETLS